MVGTFRIREIAVAGRAQRGDRRPGAARPRRGPGQHHAEVHQAIADLERQRASCASVAARSWSTWSCRPRPVLAGRPDRPRGRTARAAPGGDPGPIPPHERRPGRRHRRHPGLDRARGSHGVILKAPDDARGRRRRRPPGRRRHPGGHPGHRPADQPAGRVRRHRQPVRRCDSGVPPHPMARRAARRRPRHPRRRLVPWRRGARDGLPRHAAHRHPGACPDGRRRRRRAGRRPAPPRAVGARRPPVIRAVYSMYAAAATAELDAFARSGGRSGCSSPTTSTSDNRPLLHDGG